MGRYPEPPSDFDCPYQHCCPHLEGLSTSWTFHEYQESSQVEQKYWRLHDEYEAEITRLEARIRELEQQNAELQARLTALHRRQFKAAKTPSSSAPQSGTSRAPPSNCPPKKRGPPHGHPGWHRRPPDHVDEEVIVPAPTSCPYCGADHLLPSDTVTRHLQEDIVLVPRTRVTMFTHHHAVCPHCRRRVTQAAEGEVLDERIGPLTKATAVFLRYGMRLSYRKVQELFDVLFGMPFVPASALQFDRAATARGTPLYEDLKHKLRASAVAHADETHWRENGRSRFMWYGGNDDVAVFHIDPSRAGRVAADLFGARFAGALVTDGYAGYNAVNAASRQACLAHLIRKAAEIAQVVELIPEARRDHASARFCADIATVFRDACDCGRDLASGRLSYRRAARLVPRFYSRVTTLCSSPLSHPQADSFRRRLLDPAREYDRLFTFLTVPASLPPTTMPSRHCALPSSSARSVSVPAHRKAPDPTASYSASLPLRNVTPCTPLPSSERCSPRTPPPPRPPSSTTPLERSLPLSD